MRIDRFLGMVPKNPPAHLQAGGARWAENCFLSDGSQLIPEREPLILPDRIFNPDGSLFTGAPITLWRSGDVWVGWDHHVEVCHDYRNFPNRNAFLYVDGGSLYRCCDEWILQSSGPRPVGIQRPPVFPVVTVLGTDTEIWSARPKDIVGDKVSCPVGCEDGAQPGEVRSYVFTYVNDMGEESAPSDPSEPTRIPIGQACVVADPATNVPANAVARRWYRSLAGEKGATWRFVRETNSAFLSDTLDALQLGDELQVVEHWPPPAPLKGVCRLGVDLTMLWDEENNIHVSAPRLPHAYPPQNRQKVHHPIVRAVATIQQFEGRTSYFEVGSGYTAYVLTQGVPYAIVAEGGEKRAVSVHSYEVDEPIVSPRAATEANGTCLYASPRGIIQLEFGQIKSLTDDLFTQEQWTKMQPHQSFLTFQRGRLFSFGSAYSWYLPVSDYIKDRAPLLSAVSIRATAAYASPQSLTLGMTSGTLLRWDGNTSFLRAEWHSGDYQSQEYWNPGAVKIDTVLPFVYSPRADDAWQDYRNWRRIYGACADESSFYSQNPKHEYYRDFINYMKSPIEVEIFCEGRLHSKHVIISRYPIRLPRQGRGIYWSIKVKTRLPIFRIMLEKSIKDMARDYEPQTREYST